MSTRPLVLLLLGVLTLTGCATDGAPGASTAAAASSSASSSSSPSLSSDAPPSAAASPPARPARQVCRRLSYAQAVAPTNDAEPTPCAAAHTAETFAVGELRTINAGHLLAVDSAVVQRQVAETCPRRLAKFVGGTAEDLRLSMLRAVWFTPTVAQSDAGANWFRCDVVVIDAKDRLADVRGRLQGVLATPEGRERYGMCGTDKPGAADFERTVCRNPHSWRAIGTVDLLEGTRTEPAPYPGVRSVRDAGQDLCNDQGRAVADDALDYRWGYEWPTATQWATGQTYGRCWAPDGSAGG